MKKITVAQAAEFLGFEKVGRFYYDHMYVQGYVGYDDGVPFGYEQVYISDGEYADSTAYTSKQILKMYEEYIEENPEEAL